MDNEHTIDMSGKFTICNNPDKIDTNTFKFQTTKQAYMCGDTKYEHSLSKNDSSPQTYFPPVCESIHTSAFQQLEMQAINSIMNPYVIKKNSLPSDEKAGISLDCITSHGCVQNVECGSNDTSPFSDAYTGRRDLHQEKYSLATAYTTELCDDMKTQKGRVIVQKQIHSVQKALVHNGCEQENKYSALMVSYDYNKCGKVFRHPGNLQKHQFVHTGQRSFASNECGYKCSHNRDIRIHRQVQTGEKPYRCDPCGKAFTCKSKLIAHQRKHTGERPFLCDVCGNAYRHSGSFERHLKMHTGEIPYVCKLCGHAFAWLHDLVGHNRIHTGEKPHVCDQCGMNFRLSTKYV